ncbi:MAG: hypothetical protein HC905_28305 [Bacteroidales bacterium]|nr:hypothetical protein [Bacteroidales bacterium]
MIPVFILILITFQAFRYSLPEEEAKIRFTTNDSVLKNIYNRAVELAYENIVDYGSRKVMIEGAKYRSIWLETQPMAGYMFAKQNLEIGRNNIEIFMDYQREDGRLPGVIYNRNGKVEPNYCQFQGLCFPMPAFELYFLLTGIKHI